MTKYFKMICTLNLLYAFVSFLLMGTIRRFLSARSKAFHLSSVEERQSIAEHPNGAYALIKLFTTDWANVLERNPGIFIIYL